jgi:hypothetical protein
MTTVLETITEAFARTYTSAGSTAYDQSRFIDETAGSLGGGAAVLGATIAGLDEPDRRHVERLGRGLSTAREINHVLDTGPDAAIVVLPTLDEPELRMYAERRRDDAEQAFDALSETADLSRLRAFAEATAPRRD